METISKTCKTMKEAVAHQNRFYKMYYFVDLISFPMYGECGEYVWKVCK